LSGFTIRHDNAEISAPRRSASGADQVGAHGKLETNRVNVGRDGIATPM
jgi:hypothetical protein